MWPMGLFGFFFCFKFVCLLSYVINIKICSYAHLNRLLQSFVINMYIHVYFENGNL